MTMKETGIYQFRPKDDVTVLDSYQGQCPNVRPGETYQIEGIEARINHRIVTGARINGMFVPFVHLKKVELQ